MIKTIHRPQTLEEALRLLAQPDTAPLGGGTWLTQQRLEAPAQLVDLQDLELNTLEATGTNLEIGATVTLQTLLTAAEMPAALKQALRLEAPLNLRNQATLGGLLMAGDGRSPVLTALLALDAEITLARPATDGSPETFRERIGNWLPLRTEKTAGVLITAISLPLQARLAFESVGRTPSDRPFLAVAVAQWPSGRTRVAAGGWGKLPALAMDGKDGTAAAIAVQNVCHEAADEFASAEYRREVGATLARRALQQLAD